MSQPTNWLATRNPFDLQRPPKWFLRELAAYDDQLVIFPSLTAYHYRLTRRKNRSPGITAAISWNHDSAVCVEQGLIPVTSFRGDIVFGPQIFQWLREHDQWKLGGVDGVERRMQEIDAHNETQIQRSLDSDNDARAHSMWETYQRRVGARVNKHDPNRGRVGRPKNPNRVTVAGSAPVPPAGWKESPSGLITPPTL